MRGLRALAVSLAIVCGAAALPVGAAPAEAATRRFACNATVTFTASRTVLWDLAVVWSWSVRASGACRPLGNPTKTFDMTTSGRAVASCGEFPFTESHRTPYKRFLATTQLRNTATGATETLNQAWYPTKVGPLLDVELHIRYPAPTRSVYIGGVTGNAVGTIGNPMGTGGAKTMRGPVEFVMQSEPIPGTPGEEFSVC
jgi:hypothetical protein